MSHDKSQKLTKEEAFSLYEAGQHSQAKAACQSFCKIVPDDPDVWGLLCVINGILELNEEAELCGQRAIDLAPDYVLAYFNTAVAQLNLKKADAAIAGFQKVLQYQPDHGFALYLMGRCYELQLGQDRKAMASYEKALGLYPQPPQLAVRLVNLYERIGDKGSACQLLDRSLAARPNDPELGAIKARMDVDNGLFDDARERLEGLISSGTLTSIAQAGILNELGLVLDKLGEYDKAFEILTEGHRIASEGVPESRKEIYYNIINRCRDVTTPGNVAVWQHNAPERDLVSPIFLVGFPRSGTTLTERILASHPDVRTSSEEGLLQGVIDKLDAIAESSQGYPYNLNDLTKDQVALLRDEYWSLAKQKCGALPGEKEFLDKSALNIVDMCLIYRIFPEARVVLLLRDPRDVCLSCFMQHFTDTPAMANFYSLENTARFYDAVMSLWCHYKTLLELDLYELRYEDIASDTEATIKDLIRFLRLSWDDQVLHYHKNKDYKAQTPSYQDTCKPIFKNAIARWQNYQVYMRPVMTFLQTHIERFGYHRE